MNTACKSLCFAVLSLSLAACASTSEPRAVALAPDDPDALDMNYMATVELAKKETGAEVLWVNPPRVRDRDDQD